MNSESRAQNVQFGKAVTGAGKTRILQGISLDMLNILAHPMVDALKVPLQSLSKQVGLRTTLAILLGALPATDLFLQNGFFGAQPIRNFLAHLKAAILREKWCTAIVLRDKCPQLNAPSKQTLESGVDFLESAGLVAVYAAHVASQSSTIGNAEMAFIKPILKPVLGLYEGLESRPWPGAGWGLRGDRGDRDDEFGVLTPAGTYIPPPETLPVWASGVWPAAPTVPQSQAFYPLPPGYKFVTPSSLRHEVEPYGSANSPRTVPRTDSPPPAPAHPRDRPTANRRALFSPVPQEEEKEQETDLTTPTATSRRANAALIGALVRELVGDPTSPVPEVEWKEPEALSSPAAILLNRAQQSGVQSLYMINNRTCRAKTGNGTRCRRGLSEIKVPTDCGGGSHFCTQHHKKIFP